MSEVVHTVVAAQSTPTCLCALSLRRDMCGSTLNFTDGRSIAGTVGDVPSQFSYADEVRVP